MNSRGITSLFLLRHGTTQWNLEGRYHSQTDVPLHPSARLQVLKVGDLVRNAEIKRCITSCLTRSVDTARILQSAGDLQTEIETLSLLNEVDFGSFEGFTKEELRIGHAESYLAWRRSDSDGPAAPGGESWDSGAARARAVLDSVAADKRSTIAIAHSYVLRLMIIGAVGGLPPQAIRRFAMGNSSLSILHHTESSGWRVISLNSNPSGTG